jgi:hypothetical protein
MRNPNDAVRLSVASMTGQPADTLKEETLISAFGIKGRILVTELENSIARKTRMSMEIRPDDTIGSLIRRLSM